MSNSPPQVQFIIPILENCVENTFLIFFFIEFQYLVLKLQNISIVKYIKFGKYERPHVCNLKRFKVYGGLQDDTKIELLYR